jgi:UDP-2,3-diacylglucosamine hydrolase
MPKYYFLSDAHIGTDIVNDRREHERRLVAWLDTVCRDATEIFLVGDIFDFWFEYRSCVPKGCSRLLGKLAEITDSGIPVHFFIGNHDLWTFGYLEQEVGLRVYKTPQIFELLGQRLFITHGDGLNDKSKIFGFTRKLFHSRLMQRCFDFIHPNIGIPVGRALSNGNRRKHSYSPYRGENDEPLVEFAKNYPASERIDYFIFGHRHILLDLRIATGSRVVILGDFYEEFSYAVLDETGLSLEHFQCQSIG